MNAEGLIESARLLLAREGGATQCDTKRAVSTLYYALFHELAKACADHFAGEVEGDRSKWAWRQVYRNLAHNFVAEQCKKPWFEASDFPAEIKKFAADFVELQIKRHKADYNPFYEVDPKVVAADIPQVVSTINSYRAVPLRDRRAFSIWILLSSKHEDQKPAPQTAKKQKGKKTKK